MKRNFRLLMEMILLLAGKNARLEKRRVPSGRPEIMASSASSDALGFPVRGMPKTVREKNIIFNVIKYFEDEKECHGKQKFRPNAVMQKAAEATGVPLRTLQRLSNANSESKKIKSKKAKLSREKFGKLDDFDLGVIRRLFHQFYLRNESPTLDKILKELKEKWIFRMADHVCINY